MQLLLVAKLDLLLVHKCFAGGSALGKEVGPIDLLIEIKCFIRSVVGKPCCL